MGLFFVILFLDSLILQPFRCIIGFIFRFLWHPPSTEYFKSLQGGDELNGLTSNEELKTIVLDRLNKLDINYYTTDDDSAKFLGLLYASTKKEEFWNYILKLFDSNTFLRKPNGISNDIPDFSSDMLSGVLFAIFTRFSENKLTSDEIKTLCQTWNNITWSGIPLTIPHPLLGKRIGRGMIWEPWTLWSSNDVLAALVWLFLGYKITSDKKYIIAYWIMFVLQFPSLLLASSDGQFFIKNIYGMSPHQSHSKNLLYIVGYKLTNSFIFKMAIEEKFKRMHETNLDMLVLYNKFVKKLSIADEKRMNQLFMDMCIKGSEESPQNKKYLSIIWPPEIVMRSSIQLPPSKAGNKYVSERSTIKGSVMSNELRERYCLDLIVPYFLNYY